MAAHPPAAFELQAVLDAAVDGIVIVDGAGRVENCNRAADRLFGLPPGGMIGMHVDRFLVQPSLEAAAAMEGTGRAHEISARRADGTVFPVSVSVARISGSPTPRYISFVHDDSQRRAGVEALRKSEQLLTAAQALANLGNFEVRLPGGPAYWSPQMYRIVGMEPTDDSLLFAAYLERFVHPDDQQRFMREWQRAADTDGKFDVYYRVLRVDGVVREVHSIAQLARQSDGTISAVGTVHDVTERRRAEDEIRQAQERLTQFARLSTLGEMAAGLAHEINQPLAAIATYSQAVQRLLSRRDPSDLPEIESALEQVTAQALRAGEVIRRLREFVKNREVRQELLDARRLLEDVIVFASPDARVNDVRLKLEIATDLPDVACDPVQVQQVLLNLIRNAIDALDGQPGPARDVLIRAVPSDPDEVEFSVVDRGPGLDPDTEAHLGDPFFTTKPGGTGLGVAISRSIVRAHGGRFGYRPTPGRGATFYFTLPAVTGRPA